MTTINIETKTTNDKITWVASEHFAELTGTVYKLDEMEAVDIERLPNLSWTAKILLSAVAGAVIQHLLDGGVDPQEIFNSGTMSISMI